MSTKKDTRTYADRKDYLKLAVAKRRRQLKLKAIESAGSKCMLCGYRKHPEILDFHHINPNLKSFEISSGGFSRSWAAIQAEIRKCILVCANCNKEIERGLISYDYIDLTFEKAWPNT